MEIGQIELQSDEIFVNVRAYTDPVGERLKERLINGWCSIPIQSIIDLATEFIQLGPSYSTNDLRKGLDKIVRFEIQNNVFNRIY